MQSEGVPLVVAWLIFGVFIASVVVQAVLDYWPEITEWWRNKRTK